MPANMRFIAGRAGSGKSRMINYEIEKLCREGKSPVLIVSEQFTFEAERALSMRLGGLMGVEVFSFTSLAQRVLPEGLRFLSRQGRRMVIRRVVEERRSELGAFRGVSERPGFSGKCEEIFSLCKRCEITPQALQQAAGLQVRDALLKEKLTDIALLYGAVEDALKDRISEEDALVALRGRLTDSFLVGRDIFIDGCDIWAEQIFGVIEGMMDCAASLTHCVRADFSKTCRDRALFAPEFLSYERLRAAAQIRGCAIERVELPVKNAPWGESRYISPVLSHLEHEIFADKPQAFPGEPEGLRVFAATDRNAEAEAVADAAQSLAITGMRYRDMAVVAADLNAYADVVQRVFRRRGIPCYTDAKHPLADYPLPRLLLFALRCVSRGYAANDVLSLAKTGLAGPDREETECLENYVLRYGLRGNTFANPFSHGEAATAPETARQRLMEPLMSLREALFKGKDAKAKTEALYSYMEALGVGEKTEARCAALRAAGRLAAMEENMQVYETVMQLFSQLYGIMGETRMSTARFLAIFEEGVSAYEVGSIPATADQVLLGSIDRTKARPLKAMFLMGALQGVFPQSADRDRVIDDAELSQLYNLGLNTWNSADMNAAVYRLDAYNALTKPAEFLMLSYPACGEDGARSSLVDRVCALFPTLAVETNLLRREPMDAAGGFPMLGGELRAYVDTGAEPRAALYAWYATDKAYAPRLLQVEEALYHDASPAPFDRALARSLYGETGSASRLETFNTCPFRHLARYGLKLEPRREYRERPADEGLFCHEALARYTQMLIAREMDVKHMDEEVVDSLLSEILPPLMASHNGGVLLSTARSRALCERLTGRVRATALAITRQLAGGGFRIEGSELEFGPGKPWPALRLHLPDGTSYLLSGKIDRLDSFEDPAGRAYRVIDYKLSGADFDYSELFYGLKLQLPIYLAALLGAGKTARAVGMYYLPIRDPVAEAEAEEAGDVKDAEEKLEADLQKQFALSGLTLSDAQILRATNEDFIASRKGRVSGEAMARIIGYAKEKAADTVMAILEGHAEVSPCRKGKGLACDYCDYRSLCGFDNRNRACRFRDTGNMDLQEFLEKA